MTLPGSNHERLAGVLLDPAAATMSPAATALIDVLGRSKPDTIDRWIDRNPDRIAMLRRIVAGEESLSHDTLDRLGRTQPVEQLRRTLTNAGLLPPRHDPLALFDSWCARHLATIERPVERQLITTYIAWGQRRRLLDSVEAGRLRAWSTHGARQQIRVAGLFLDWLTERGTVLDDCSQADLDHWFASGPTTRAHSVSFVVWAKQQRLCDRRLRLPKFKPPSPAGMPDRERVELIATLIGDDTISLDTRVAGLLVVLYAQPVSRIANLRCDHITHTSGHVNLDVVGHELELVTPLDQLIIELAAAGDGGWLFPGAHPTRSLHPKDLGQRLLAIGVTRAARVGALHSLVEQIASTVLAEMIGYNPNFIAERAATLAAPWASYPALRQTK